MYLHLGQDTVVLRKDIIGIFDMETSTISQTTRDTLAAAQKSGCIVNVSMEMPKSFVLCKSGGKTTVYITQISSSTLLKRAGLRNETNRL
ncbi:extracellular matrix regulator RemB [Caproicibacter sp.]|uniref:extracellular matrix regulator RemB n=1 Tax=Caproicibacter sp. TaxID=2814884 RepID=UPI003988C1F1